MRKDERPVWLQRLITSYSIDWIVHIEQEGYNAYKEGETDLNEAFKSRGLDVDCDADMAFVLGWRKAQRQAAANTLGVRMFSSTEPLKFPRKLFTASISDKDARAEFIAILIDINSGADVSEEPSVLSILLEDLMLLVERVSNKEFNLAKQKAKQLISRIESLTQQLSAYN